MSVYRNIVVIGVIGAIISNAGQGSSTPPPVQPEGNAPENSILDPEVVKQESEVTETQGVKSNSDSLEEGKFPPQGSLLENLKSNSTSSSLGTEIESKRNLELNLNQKSSDLKTNQETISAIKNLESLSRNQGSLLTKLKVETKAEDEIFSGLQIQQNINAGLAVNKNKDINLDQKKLGELEEQKSNSSLLNLLKSASDNSQGETESSSEKVVDLSLNKEQDKLQFNSQKLPELENNKSNSSLLNLLGSKSDNSQGETESSSEKVVDLSLNKEPDKLQFNSQNSSELEEQTSSSSLLNLLHSPSDNSQGETESSSEQLVDLSLNKYQDKLSLDSPNSSELEEQKSNSSLLNLLQSPSENSQIGTEINLPRQTALFLNKEQDKLRLDSQNLSELEEQKSNSSLLNLLQSPSDNSQGETESSSEKVVDLSLNKEPDKLQFNSPNLAELEEQKSSSSLLNLLQSPSDNSQSETESSSEKVVELSLNKEQDKLQFNSQNLAELENNKSNSSLFNLLQSPSENYQIGTETNLPRQTALFLNKDQDKLSLDSPNSSELEEQKSNSSLLNLLQSPLNAENPEEQIANNQTINLENQTDNIKNRQPTNRLLGNSYQLMTSINRAPAMATINDLSQIETEASALNNPQRSNNQPIKLPGRTNQNIVTTIQRPPTFGNTSRQKNSAQIVTSLNSTSNTNLTTNTVPNLARVQNQKNSSNSSTLIIAQENTESFPPPVPNGTLQTNPPPQIEPNSNPLNYPISPDEVQIKETIPITLQEAIDLARRNNPEIQISQLEVERSRAAMREAQGALWPSLTFESTIERIESAIGDLQAKANQRRTQAELAKQGLEDEEFEDLDTDIQNFPVTTFSNTFQFDYDLGLGKARSSRIGVAREQMRLRELELERVSEELRLNVSEDYYNLQQADGRVRIGEAAVRNARKSLEDAEALERAGVGTRFDVLQAQVTLSNEQQNLTNALRDQRTSQRRLAERLNANELINLTAADPIEPAGSWLLSLDETIVAAFQNRAELEQQLVQRDLSDEQRKLALSSVRPNLNFFATYNVLALTTENQDFRAARGWADGSTIGLRFRWNFFDGGAARAAARQSIIDGQIAETRFEQVRNQIRREVEESFFGLEASFENISTAELGVEQAKEALRLARLRFQAGVGTQLEVIQQETDLTRAEDNLLTAIIDYNRSLSQLQRSVSNLPGGNLSDTP